MTRTELTLEGWPSQGRVGIARAGDWADCHVFVWPEIWSQWGFYASDGTDDVFPASLIQRRVDEADVDWLSGDEELTAERELFAMRPITASQFDWPEGVLSRMVGAWSRLRHGPTDIDSAVRAWEARLRSERTKPARDDTKRPPEERAPVRSGDPTYWGLIREGRIAGAVRVQRYRGWGNQRTSRWFRRTRAQWVATESFWHEIVVVEGLDPAQAQTHSDYYDGPHDLGVAPMVDGWTDFWLADTQCLVVAFDEQRWGRPDAWFAEWDAGAALE